MKKVEKKLGITTKRTLAYNALQNSKSDRDSFCNPNHYLSYCISGYIPPCCWDIMGREMEGNKKIVNSASEKELDAIIKKYN